MNKQRVDIANEDVDQILEIISTTYGYDFCEYARASMLRRITRFMEDAGIPSAADLQIKLVGDPSTFELFLQKVTVNVTEMFRDPFFYKAMKEQVIPMLATYPSIKIWHAGCSSGEEVFSMAILLQEAGLLQRTRIYATDINPANLEKAKTGMVPLSAMRDYTTNYIKASGASDFSGYYTSGYDYASIRKDLRERIIFSQHNLVTDQVFNEFQLIVCRNVLIYFNKNLQNRVIKLFYESLGRLGYLALGVKESLLFTDVRDTFDPVNQQQKIFRKSR